jgi:amidohydrolase
LISALQSLVSRNTDPTQGLVLSVTRVQAGTATNIIPDEMLIAGTIRALRPGIREMALFRLEELAGGICHGFGLRHELTLGEGYPPMTNHEAVSRFVADAAAAMIGKDRVLIRNPKFGSEDFGYFLAHCPGAGFELGCSSKEKGRTQMLHTPRFDLDESILALGTELYVRLVERFFEG